jgi:AcrR family transcriptional regulator
MHIAGLPCPSRREASRQSRREAILVVAERSFLEQGYAATSMSAIAAELGGSKGTLWSYFPAKDVLFAAVLDRATEAFQQQLTLILNPQDALDTTLCRFAQGVLKRVTSPESLALYRLVMAEANRFPETGRIFHERAMGRTLATLTAYLAQAKAQGLLQIDDARLAAQQLLGLCLSGCHQRLLLRVIDSVDPAMIEAEARAAVATFLRAYRV